MCMPSLVPQCVLQEDIQKFAMRTHRSCQCGDGEYQSSAASSQQCLTGRETSTVACSPGGPLCGDGQFMQGSCDGTQTFNNASCGTCKAPASSGTCSAALPNSNFEQPCSSKDCARRQALFYPFHSWDIGQDLAPRGRPLIPVSASSRSSGPSVTLDNAKTGGVSAAFNASNHEYFQIPSVSLFDRQLGYRIVRNTSSTFEVGMTLCFWVRFSSSAGSGQSLFELSNGISTENVYVRRIGSTAELVFGVSHTSGSVKKEYSTINNTIPFSGIWQHVAWTILGNAQSYDATWNIFINAGYTANYTGIPGVMPIDGTYTYNFIGFGTPVGQAFFTGAMDDFRLYERALSLSSIRAIYGMDACCHFPSGSYIDMTKPCTGLDKYDPHFCKACRMDCGPMQYIASFDSRCNGQSTQDTTTCLPCKRCGVDQYVSQICSGTTFFDEQLCPQCKFVSNEQCPAGQVLVGRCDGTQEYDTSACMTCLAECVSYVDDPQVPFCCCFHSFLQLQHERMHHVSPHPRHVFEQQVLCVVLPIILELGMPFSEL